MKKLGILGMGHMGGAILKGSLTFLPPEEIGVYDPSSAKKEEAASMGLAVYESESALCDACHMVLTAVRPQDIAGLLENMKGHVPPCILTIAAGIPIRRFTGALGEVPVIRAMPNTPLQIGCGAVALCHSNNCAREDILFAETLFSKLGTVAWIDESHMCDIIAVNGSTPAYFYYYIQCMLEDAVRRGIPEADARNLLVETMIGSGLLLRNSPEKPISKFVDEVCSKGGTTIEAIEVLKQSSFAETIEKADSACIQRAEELGRQY